MILARLFTPTLLCIALSGCALAPGQHLETGTFLGGEASEDSNVEIIPITPKLLSVQQAVSQSRQATSLPVELLNFKPAPYRVGVGDVLQVIVWDHPELSAPAGQQQQTEANGRQVRHDGTMFFPFVGSISVAGKTLGEIREELSQKLKQWIEVPQVDVNAIRINSAKVTFSGAFERPTEQAVSQAPLSLMAAVGNAGIKSLEADLTGLTLIRDGKEYRIDLDAWNRGESKSLDTVFLKPGDHLHLAYNDRRKVYILGEIARPGSYAFKTNSLPLSDVIGLAGGIRQETANGDAVYVIRGAVENQTAPIRVFHLSARSPVSMALASRFELQPQDVVFVGPAGIVRWNRFLSQLLPTAGFINTGSRTAIDLRNN